MCEWIENLWVAVMVAFPPWIWLHSWSTAYSRGRYSPRLPRTADCMVPLSHAVPNPHNSLCDGFQPLTSWLLLCSSLWGRNKGLLEQTYSPGLVYMFCPLRVTKHSECLTPFTSKPASCVTAEASTSRALQSLWSSQRHTANSSSQSTEGTSELLLRTLADVEMAHLGCGWERAMSVAQSSPHSGRLPGSSSPRPLSLCWSSSPWSPWGVWLQVSELWMPKLCCSVTEGLWIHFVPFSFVPVWWATNHTSGIKLVWLVASRKKYSKQFPWKEVSEWIEYGIGKQLKNQALQPFPVIEDELENLRGWGAHSGSHSGLVAED